MADISSTFQLLYFDGLVQQIFNSCWYNNGIKQTPNHW